MSTSKKTPNKRSSVTTSKKKTVKKVVKKPVSKKPVKPTKTLKPRLKKAATGKKIPHSKIKKVPSAASKKPINLPANMPVRSLTKARLLRIGLSKNLNTTVFRVAYISGLCLMFVGATLTASYISVLNEQNSQVATSYLASTTSIVYPVFTEHTAIPEVTITPFRYNFSLTNISAVTVKLRAVGSGIFDVPLENLLNDKYRADIPADLVPHGFYKITLYIDPLDPDLHNISRSSKEFFIGTQSEYDTYFTSSDTTKTTSDSLSSTTTSVNTTTKTNTSETSGTGEPVEIIADTIIYIDDTPDDRSGKVFAIFTIDDLILTGLEQIGVSTPNDYSYIELYARPLNSINSRFITIATKRFERWQFLVNTEQLLPNGKYELTAQTKFNGETIKSKPLYVEVYNPVVSTPAYTPPVYIQEQTDSTNVTARDFVSVDDGTYVPKLTLEEDVARETANLLLNNSSELEILFQRYAVARQSGNEILIQTAKDALQEKQQELVSSTLQDARVRDIADNIDLELSARIDDFLNRVDTFENIRKEKSDGQTAVDTDGDGISNYDEIHLYNTDPTIPDTDNDGINDGVEIIRGFNPVDAAPEAIIEFESPKNSISLVRPNELVIHDVVPVIPIDTPSDSLVQSTEIRGEGLPNSFVTLYIFSSPTVVTIKTDVDGSFVYTFDKELADGRHDIYVAITDNAGDIIAQSNPFSFIKEAQAFTPVDADENTVITPDTILDSTESTYGTVAGMGILALGLILIMLGISLRPKGKDDDIDGTEEIREASKPEDKKIKMTVSSKKMNKKSSVSFDHIDAS